MDNNSTDGTPELSHRLAAAHPTVVATACATPGASAARNHGVALARGEWTQFLDADDELRPRKLAEQLTLAEPDTAWIISGYRNHYPGGTTDANLPHPDPWKGLVFRYRTGYTCSNLYRRDALTALGGWNEALPNLQDPELHFRLLAADLPYVIDAQVRADYHHRATGQITKTDVAGGCRRRLELLEHVNAHLKARRPAYWADNRNYFRGAWLRAARILFTHDPAAAAGAVQGTEQQWPDWDHPELLSPLRWWAYRRLGFGRTEGMRVALAGWLPEGLKRRLK